MSYHFRPGQIPKLVALYTLEDVATLITNATDRVWVQHARQEKPGIRTFSLDLRPLRDYSTYMFGESKFCFVHTIDSDDDGKLAHPPEPLHELADEHVHIPLPGALQFLASLGAVPLNEPFIVYYDW